MVFFPELNEFKSVVSFIGGSVAGIMVYLICLLYTSDAADERSSVDLGGRRIIKKKYSNIVSVTDTRKSNTLHMRR